MANKINTVLLLVIIFILFTGLVFAMYAKNTAHPQYEYETKRVLVSEREACNKKMGAEGWEIVSIVCFHQEGAGPAREITYKRRK